MGSNTELFVHTHRVEQLFSGDMYSANPNAETNTWDLNI